MSKSYNERAILVPGSFGIGALLTTIDHAVIQPIVAWRQALKTQRELLALDDHQLADIGLSRSDIDGAAFRPGHAPAHRA